MAFTPVPHRMRVPEDIRREWAGSDDCLRPLRSRLRAAGAHSSRANRLLDRATADSSWRSIAALDASLRMVDSLVRSGGLRRGREASEALAGIFEAAAVAPDSSDETALAAHYWSVRPAETTGEGRRLARRRAGGVHCGAASGAFGSVA